MAFLRPEVQDRLVLKPEQVRTVQSSLAAGRRSMMKALGIPDAGPLLKRAPMPQRTDDNARSDPAQDATVKRREAMLRVRVWTTRKVENALTAEQKAEYARMLGAPYEFRTLQGIGTEPTTETKPRE